MGWRVRLARGVLRAATWLAWRIAGQAAFGRWLRAQARTAAGPGEAMPAEPMPTAAPPLPTAEGSVCAMAETARWWVEEALRNYEQFSPARGDEILYALVAVETGLLYQLERRLGGL